MKKEKTIHELMKEHPDKSYREMEKYREADRQEEAGVCVMGEMRKDREFEKEIDYHRYWKDMYEKEHKLRQEAEGELTILKGIETNRVKEAQARSSQLQDEVDKVKKENNDLYNKIADLTEVTKSKDYFHDPDYKFLVEENRKLEEERNELLMDNKKLAAEIEDRVARARKSGM